MRITVFGATGGTGTQLVHQALALGHHVTAVVRDPSRLVLPPAADAAQVPAGRAAAGDVAGAGDVARGGAGAAGRGGVGEGRDFGGRLVVVTADVMDPRAIEGLVAGADAVVSAIGPRGKGPSTACADSIGSVLRAARASGTRRILMVSAAGMITDDGDGLVTRFVVKPILGRVLREAFTDMRAAEARLWENDLDWTIVRPPMLTNKPRTGTYRVSLDRNLRGGRTIARADLADYLLRAIPDRATIRHAVTVAY